MLEKEKTIVEFRAVSCCINSIEWLEYLILEIVAGEMLVMLGESGCGQTTTLGLINRLIELTKDKVLVEGKSTIHWDAIKLG